MPTYLVKSTPEDKEVTSENVSEEFTIVYVLGGPGSGKDTQCSKIAASFGFVHLCVGDLLEKQVASGSRHGPMIKEYKKEGKLLPTEIVINVLQQAIEGSPTKKFLINGFPRNEENRVAAHDILKFDPDFVLFLECSKEVMTTRLLSRDQGRADDNEKTAAKRINIFSETTTPVIDYYNSKGKVIKINGEQSKEEVFEDVKHCFEKFYYQQPESKHEQGILHLP